MRLNRLDLARYGKFTDRSIDFGRATAGSPDLHVVYGPNEAGKSTLFSAFLDLLFGIEHTSGYGFLHPYATMRVGGEIEAAGRTHTAYRVKRKQNTLLGPDEQPLPDNLFSGVLGAIDRATYQMMFSLDDDSIEKGGESILKSEGELGTLLFSASSGLPDSNAVLSEVKAEADGFYRPQGRKHRLGELKAELEALKQQRNVVDINARDFASRRKQRDLAAERHEKASQARTDVRLALDFTRDKIGGLELLERWRGLRTELAAFRDDPDPPTAWHGILPELMRREVALTTRLLQLDEALRRQDDALSQIEPDAAILAIAERVAALDRTDLEARHVTAIKDMPSRQEELQRVRDEVARLMARLGRDAQDDAERLVLPAAIAARLQALAQQHSGIAEQVSAARRELAQAETEYGSAQQAVATLASAAGADVAADDPTPLADLVRELRRDDCLTRRKVTRREILRLEGELEDCLAALPPIDGGADALLAQPVPADAEIAEWKRRSALHDATLQTLEERTAAERRDIAAEEARLAELTAQDGFAADDAAAAVRQVREDAWVAHKKTLSQDTAIAFENAMRRDDEASSLRLAQSERLAEARGLALSLAERRARLGACEVQRLETRTAMESVNATVAEAAQRCGLMTTPSLLEFESWLGLRRTALEARAALRRAQSDLAAIAAEEADLLTRLHQSLRPYEQDVKAPETLEDAIVFAETLSARLQAARGERHAAADRVKRTEKLWLSRKDALLAAEAAFALWSAAWDDAQTVTWLGACDPQIAPAEVGPVLLVIQELERLLQKKADLDHRIDGMARDQAIFAASVGAIAAELEPPGAESDPQTVWNYIKARLSTAREQEVYRERIAAELRRMQAEQAEVAGQQALNEAEKRGMLDFFGCETLIDVDARLEAIKARDRIRERVAETGRDLCARLRVSSTDEAEAILSVVDAPELNRDLAVFEQRLAECDREAAEAHAEFREADRGLSAIAGDDSAAWFEERRRTILADIEDRALTYLRLRTGILSTELALRLYRERHRSAMMQRASAAFNRISGGEYTGLSTQSENGREFLIANAATGASKLADSLSKGTRFQLYLALRMAGYHEIAATRESLPFIADDIMETFDDGRAGHAFGLMADMARVGQVIYLTHHRHLCDIAQAACPGVSIHAL